MPEISCLHCNGRFALIALPGDSQWMMQGWCNFCPYCGGELREPEDEEPLPVDT